MSSSLEDLFDQILHSEQKAEERKGLLNEVNEEIAYCTKRFAEIKDKNSLLQDQLAMKVQQLNTEEIQQKWLTSRYNILQDKLTLLKTENHAVQKQFEELNDQTEKELDGFCYTAEEFYHSYDLVSSGSHQRELKLQELCAQLHKDVKLLEADVATCQEQEKAALQTKQKCKCLKQQISEKQQLLQRMDSEIKTEENRLNCLKSEKATVSKIPQNGSEYIWLQRELDSCHGSSLEGLCGTLQQELQELQRHQWQNEMQERQQHRLLNRAIVTPGTKNSTSILGTTNTSSSEFISQNMAASPTMTSRTNFRRFTNYSHPLDPDADIEETILTANEDVTGSGKGKKRKPNIARISQAVKKQVGESRKKKSS